METAAGTVCVKWCIKGIKERNIIIYLCNPPEVVQDKRQAVLNRAPIAAWVAVFLCEFLSFSREDVAFVALQDYNAR